MLDKDSLEAEFGKMIIIWCSFCSSCEADAGTLSFVIDGQQVEMPICHGCVEKAREADKI